MVFLVNCLLLFHFCPIVLGHGYISDPKPRALTIPGHPFQYEPQSDAARGQNCKDNGKTGPIQTTYTEGETISPTVHITIFHQGWHELRFCPDPKGGLSCYQKYRATAVPSSKQYAGKRLANNDGNDDTKRADFPLGNICDESWNGSPCPTTHCFKYGEDANFYQTVKWKLPQGLTCDHCGMQWWYVTDNGGNENFKSCHDVAIKPKSNNTECTDIKGKCQAFCLKHAQEAVSINQCWGNPTYQECKCGHPIIDNSTRVMPDHIHYKVPGSECMHPNCPVAGPSCWSDKCRT